MEYICEHCGKGIGKAIGGGLSIERLGEDGRYNFRLCAKCAKELIAYVDSFVDPCMRNHKVEEPHRIVNEDVLLKEASRQDVRDFLIKHGIDEEMAFAISEKVRKGHFSSGSIPQSMMDALGKADVPEWFVEGCKKVVYLSDRKNYSTPSLVDDEESEDNCAELKQLIKLEITECE
ncbi:MAG: hypothetical protein J5752_05400 [Clostridiales bacterium]|nr:hypothetical protein [Clostridiales bacterium]